MSRVPLLLEEMDDTGEHAVVLQEWSARPPPGSWYSLMPEERDERSALLRHLRCLFGDYLGTW